MIIDLDCKQLYEWLQTENNLVLLDIRETEELNIAKFPDSSVIHLPLSLIAQQGFEFIPKNLLQTQNKVVVFCHLGIRSIQFCRWFELNSNHPIYNLLGGINAYTKIYAPDVPQY